MMTPREQNGFTLVETLVAITILMVSIVGPMYAVFQAVQTTYIARDQLIATALAQEGVEYVRHTRDSNFLSTISNPGTPVPWLNGLNACTGQSCMVDVTAAETTPPVSCSGTCAPLKVSSTNLYSYDPSGSPSRFTRSVTITNMTPNDAVITSTVSWINARIPFSITVTEHLYNWL